MKIVLNKFLLTASVVLLPSLLWAQEPPPPPPPTPVGLVPIDEGTVILLIIALLFGIYIIYKQTIKRKTSI
jgi:hypothetical protein